MAIQNVRMQQKRGEEVNFDPDKILPGEFAVSIDRKIIRIGISPGVCIRLATYDAFETDMEQIKSILEEVKTIEEAVIRINTEVSENADAVVEYTELAKQYRDEAKAFRDGAEAIVGVGIATTEKAGLVKPDGTTITVDEDGTIHSSGGAETGTTDYDELENKPTINNVELSGDKSLEDFGITTADSKDNTVTFSEAATRENIATGEKHSILFGKIAKWLSALKTISFSGSYKDLSDTPSPLDTYEEITANTESGKFAGALGVQEGFEKLNNSLLVQKNIDSQISYGQATSNTVNATVNNIRVWTKGNVCCVTIHLTNAGNWSSGSSVEIPISGFPKPIINEWHIGLVNGDDFIGVYKNTANTQILLRNLGSGAISPFENYGISFTYAI